MEVVVGVLSSITTTMLLGIAGFLARNLILERLKHALQKEHTKFLDEIQWDRKAQLQAANVAEYLSLARSLKETSPEGDYRRANQMSWELAMWLPPEVYRQMTTAIRSPSHSVNELTVVIAVRRVLLEERAGDLNSDEIAHHAPGIGKPSPIR